MKIGRFRRRIRPTKQDGYILLTIILFAVIMMIAVMADAHNVANGIRHDREVELVHRGAQYSRAIKRYFKKFGSYPLRIEQLEDTNRMRFLRKRYKDPITGEDFKALHLGEIQLPTTIGVPIAGATPAAAMARGAIPGGGTGRVTAPGGSSTQPQPLGGTGPTFGGGPIIGVASTSNKKSMKEFNEKDHYKDWWFIYDPTTDRGGLINGPYNGPPKFGAATIPGAVPAGSMAAPNQPFGGPSSFGGGMQPNPQPTPKSPR